MDNNNFEENLDPSSFGIPQNAANSAPPISPSQTINPNLTPESNSKFSFFKNKVFLVASLLFILVLALAGGTYFYLSQKNSSGTTISKADIPKEPENEPEGLKIAYVKDCPDVVGGCKKKIEAVDVLTGEKSDIFLAQEWNTSFSKLAWSNSKNVLAVDMCCGDWETGLFIMNGDGNGKKLVYDRYSSAGLQWSPDGNFLAFMNHTDKTYEDFDEIKIIDTISGNEAMTFNVLDKFQSILAGYFWMPDGNSLVVSIWKVVSDKENYLESMQVSKDGQVINTFTDKFVGAAKDNQIFYTKRGDNKKLYASDLNGQNEKVVYSGGENCEAFSVKSGGLIRKNKFAFTVGGATNPYPKNNPECAMSKIAIYDLKTESTVTTAPISQSYIWSPAGKYLAVKEQPPAPANWVATQDQPYFKSPDKLNLYSDSGQLVNSLDTTRYSSSQLAFIYNVPGATDKVFGQVPSTVMARAEDKIIVNGISNISISAGFYFQKHGIYPNNLEQLAADGAEALRRQTPDGTNYGYFTCANNKEAVAFAKLKETGTYYVWSSASKRPLDIKSTTPPSGTCIYGV